MRKTLVPIAAWVIALVVLFIFSGSLVEPPAWVKWGAVLAFALLIFAAWRAPAGAIEAVQPAERLRLFATISAAALLLTLAGGGVGSLAVLLLLPPLILAREWFSWTLSAVCVLSLFATALVVDAVIIGRQLHVESVSMSLMAVAGFLAVRQRRSGSPANESEQNIRSGDTASAPVVDSALSAKGSTGFAGSPQRAIAGVDAVRGDSEGVSVAPEGSAGSAAGAHLSAAHTVSPADLARSPQIHLDPDILGRRLQLGTRQWWRSGAENRVLAEYLLDVRASTGADEVVVWLLHDGDSVLRPLAACSSNDWQERSNADKKWTAIVRWTCEASIVQCGEMDDGGGYATAPLLLDDRVLGVLCVRRSDGFAEEPEQLKRRCSHHAAYVARLVSLIDMHSSSLARTAALDSALDAVRELQDRAPVESPAGAICDAILHVCACDASALVRWTSDSGSGTVEAGAGRFEPIEHSVVTGSSIVGSTCQRGTPFRIGAAHDMLSRLSLFAEREDIGKGTLGAFCIYPMKREGEVIGALLAAWNAPTDLTKHTAPSIEVLASVAAHALHAAWRLETVQVAARTDALTGLNNRRFLDEQLSRVLSESSRYGDPASLILLDLDYFKVINDTYGHAVGDQVLKHVAATLLDGVRGVDLCARYGGEELAVLLPRTGLQGAVELAERLRSMVESRPLSLAAGRDIKVTASFGVASYPAQAPTPTALLSSADGALYRAKEAGRNRVRTALPTR